MAAGFPHNLAMAITTNQGFGAAVEMASRWRRGLRGLFGIAALAALAGCADTRYYWQSVHGHLQLM